MAATVDLAIDGPIATITNNNPDKHNVFDDDMDAQLFGCARRAEDAPRGARGDLAGRGQVVVVGA